ncbi:hypothetical protein O181_080354 [Austropuccinia psidii MF-1]|uniref:Uncharacterized protein n=1 Tax=Austropuccinia psidii MF-1 TaxID=1389203 RepID=A0A9Q3IJ39_9BASI|nr:hypothetical protein [Austropuccinia psidii MF-1]
MSFNRFTAFNYVDPDDPLAEPDLDHIINQQNQQISFLQQQPQQSHNVYQAILAKVNHLQRGKSLHEKKITIINKQRNKVPQHMIGQMYPKNRTPCFSKNIIAHTSQTHII